MLDDLGGAFQGADLADAGDVASIPLDAKFEVLVWIETLRIDAELSHGLSSLGCDLAGHLLDLDNDELGGLERCKADDDIDDAEVDIVLRRGFLVALDEIGLGGVLP